MNVRFGSKADIATRPSNVRFASETAIAESSQSDRDARKDGLPDCFVPESGHRDSAAQCLLCAKTGHKNYFSSP